MGLGGQPWDWVGRASSVGPTAVSACGLSSGEGTVRGGDGGTVGHQLELSRVGNSRGCFRLSQRSEARRVSKGGVPLGASGKR